MYARTENNAVAVDILKAVLSARSHNFIIARQRQRVANAYAGYLA